jgi:hypothetical protein
MPRSLQQRMPKAIRIPTPVPVLAHWRRAGMQGGATYTLARCNVIVAREPLGPRGELRWHLSISHPDRYPTWDEIAEARYQLLPDEAFMVMILPPSAEYVNACETCFHLHEVPEARVYG